MNKIPATEAKLLYSLPPEPRKRLRRMLFLGFLGSFLFFLFLGGALSGLMGRGLLQWKIGWILLLFSFLNLITFPFWLGRIQTPGTFYLVFGYIRMPLYAILLVFGISVLNFLLPVGSARWIHLGLICGLLFLPFVIRRKKEWIEKSLDRGHLNNCLKEKAWTWDAAHDMDHIRKDPKKMRPGFIWRVLFWIGPAIGMSLGNIFGELNALMIASLTSMMAGYLTLISIFTDTISLSFAIFRLEEERGEKIMLE